MPIASRDHPIQVSAPAFLLLPSCTTHLFPRHFPCIVCLDVDCRRSDNNLSSSRIGHVFTQEFRNDTHGFVFLSSSHRLLIVVLSLRRLIVETSHCRAMTRWQDGQCVKHRMTNKTFPDTECSRKWNISTTSHRLLIVETSHRSSRRLIVRRDVSSSSDDRMANVSSTEWPTKTFSGHFPDNECSRH